MGKIFAKVVLTGGPCAGKTSALTKIEEELIEKGYKVFIVSESATELIKGGIRPFGNGALDLLEFQKLILKYQYEKEKLYEEAVKKIDEKEKCVIIYDRGMIDNKAYVNQKIFSELLENLNLNEIEMMDNYDMVIHLVTAADGAVEAYTLENNVARTETINEAIELDRKTIDAWAGHSNLKIIDNSSDFTTKLENTVDLINNLLREPISLREQKKYLIDLNSSDLSFLNEDNSTCIHLEQSYINEKNDIETRIRKRTYLNQDSYFLTKQIKENNGISKVLIDKKISREDYNILKNSISEKALIKDRYCFTKNKQYFKLDIFEQNENYAILEIDPTYENMIIEIPNELNVIEEVTNNPYYDNHVIAETVNSVKSKKITIYNLDFIKTYK